MSSITGIGVDLVSLSKFRRILETSGQGFVAEIFASAEQSYCRKAAQPEQSYAGHFAAKEALLKAIPDLKSQGLDWSDFEVSHDAYGAPFFRMDGRLGENLRRLGPVQVQLSISHTHESAVAFVVVAGDG